MFFSDVANNHHQKHKKQGHKRRATVWGKHWWARNKSLHIALIQSLSTEKTDTKFKIENITDLENKDTLSSDTNHTLVW